MTSESPASSPPQNKRLKTLPISPITDSQQQERLESASADKNSNGENCCGICLLSLDDENSIRGYIDSCDHYFCYICILEWAKVESRCPLCKTRFNTVCRPPKQGVFSSERHIEIPKRDQVYHLLGNASVGPPDQYSKKVCSVCSVNSDDCLLLLCDLCDTASHTYCVGLGATVPEGDWFCHDCSISKTMHDKSEQDNAGDVSNSDPNVSIFDIVRDSNCRLAERSQGSVTNELTESSSKTIQNKGTLRRCENAQSRIQLIRENWDGLRNGSLRFSSSSAESSSTSQRKVNSDKVQCDNHQSSVSNNQQLLVEASRPIVQSASLRDIDKAWKMLDIAKSKKKISESASSVRLQDSKQKGTALSFGKAPNLIQNLDVAKSRLRVGEMRNTQLEARNVRSTETEKQFQNKLGMNKFSNYEKQKLSVSSSKKVNVALSTTNTTGYLDTTLKQRVQIEREAYKVNGLKQLPRDTHGSSSRPTNEHGESSSTMAFVGSVLGTYSSSMAKVEKSSDTKKRTVGFGKDTAESKSITSDDAKTEIQSLVKLNLKLLMKEKRLGVEEFKEVARVCTHTILAACGLEHRKSEARPFPSCVCNHDKEIQQLHKSTLMSSCCCECFNVFVKDIVNSIMSERM